MAIGVADGECIQMRFDLKREEMTVSSIVGYIAQAGAEAELD